MITIHLLGLLIQKVVLGLNILGIQIYYVYVSPEQLQIILQLVNIIPKEFFAYPYGDYLIKSRNHILNSCRWFRNY